MMDRNLLPDATESKLTCCCISTTAREGIERGISYAP